MTSPDRSWLARVQHDLVKRLLWPARDRRDLGGQVQSGELLPSLVDEEGNSVASADLWASLAAGAPAGHDAALAAFAAAVASADAAARRGDLQAVLALEGAFAALARSVKGED